MNLDQHIRKELGKDETIAWSEDPDPLVFLYKRGPLAILAVVVAFFIIATKEIAAENKAFVWIFSFFGISLMVSLINNIFEACNTHYVVTNKRLIVAKKPFFELDILSVYPEDIDFIRKVRRKRDSGDLYFFATRDRKWKHMESSVSNIWMRSKSLSRTSEAQQVTGPVIRAPN